MQRFEKLMVPITLVLLISLGWVFVSESNTGPSSEKTDVKSASADQTYESKGGEMGAVIVEVTPMSPSKYEISLNTHSVGLDFDLTEIIELRDDLGNTYKALSWSGETGGHHLTGTLEFADINSDAGGVTIIISEIESEVLSLEWGL